MSTLAYRKKSASGPMIAIALLSVPFTAAWYGFVLSVLWGWFVVPALGAAPLSIPAAIGIAAIVGMLLSNVAKDDSNNDPDKDIAYAAAIVYRIFSPAMSLAFGWIVHLFM